MSGGSMDYLYSAGSGTTGVVALKLGRSFLGLELNPTYCEMARKRIGAVMPLFA